MYCRVPVLYRHQYQADEVESVFQLLAASCFACDPKLRIGAQEMAEALELWPRDKDKAEVLAQMACDRTGDLASTLLAGHSMAALAEQTHGKPGVSTIQFSSSTGITGCSSSDSSSSSVHSSNFGGIAAVASDAALTTTAQKPR
jgi:hypothetical protein